MDGGHPGLLRPGPRLGLSCGHCRNYVALARERKLPEELLAILDSLSISPEKATYVCELDDRDWKEKGVLYEISGAWREGSQKTERIYEGIPGAAAAGVG